MQIVNKKLLISVVVVLIGIILIVYFYVFKGVNKISKTDAENEAEYAQISVEDVQKKPFIAKLPIKTDVYTIVYSSLNKKAVIIFNKSNESIEGINLKYQKEINLKLQEIGYTQEVLWEIQK